MSDSGQQHRRQPPSPLVFSPDNVFSPPASQTSQQGSTSNGSNTVSMPFVRRHVTRRLKAAKAECDKELQRVTNNITAFFEERLKDNDHETERDRDRDLQLGDFEHLRDQFGWQPADANRYALQTDESSSDGGYEPELDYHSRHSRQPSSTSSMSPNSLRNRQQQQQNVPWERPLSASMSSSVISSPGSSTAMLPEAPLTRKQSTAATPTSWGSQNLPSRRLSRSIHIPARAPPSGQSSRSTSRSRSPLPPLQSHPSFSEYPISSSSGNRRSSRILIDDPVDPIMTILYELIGVATDITEMSVTQLTAQPKICETLVQRVQNIGKAWEEHPDWHGRNWYVQVLLAVASLSRVVEWWEAEKQFWNFDDNEDELDEPLTFVMKPADEFAVPAPTPTRKTESSDLEDFRLNPEDDNKLRLHRPSSHHRKSRDEQPKTLSASTTHSQETLEPLRSSSSRPHDNTESARVLATERLRLQAETAQNQNIVLELSLDGDHLIWINYAWSVVVGSEPEDLFGSHVSRFLHPADAHVFNTATQRLLEDDSHTVEARFRLRVEPEGERDPPAGQGLFRQMEGKGMLMIDREEGEPSHTMWVIKPIASPRYEFESPTIALVHTGDTDSDDVLPSADVSYVESGHDDSETPYPFPQPFSTDPILCRICECHIPQWYFEKHSETCVETHRLEAEIGECNETIQELRNTIRDICNAMERSSSAGGPLEYRGMAIFSPSSSPVLSSPLQLFRANKMQRFGVKKIQRRLLDQLEDILQVAAEVSMPSLKEEEAKEPIERQRLLSPGSERKMSQIKNWSRPTIEDSALGQLVQDVERVMRQKIDTVVRMQNTIRYSEKIWHEWQERVDAHLATYGGDSDSEEGSSDDEAVGDEMEHSLRISRELLSEVREDDVDDHSSTTSEYAFNGEHGSSDPTPLAPSPAPAVPTPEQRPSSTASMASMSYGTRSLHTRSSTPSSISSPLALAAPIVASSAADEAVPAMNLDDSNMPNVAVRLSIKTRKSSSSLLEPKFVVTPPASPQILARDVALTRESSTKKGHRRHSTINPTMSPPVLGAAGPLSPRNPSVAPLSRTTPASIKDFDIIKPISKGAFGSVFLARKKVTGDYYAIKVLKKADMIAKNQITNVKAERMILMKQAESPFVAKLYFTFQSKENLYLVMEYLNGGDCAALIKTLGALPEEWTRQYIAEVVLGLEYLHERGVVHRDLKPDNLLIDQHGHLKLTDFGLSRIGLLGRQTRESQIGRPYTRYNSRSRPPSMDSAYLSSPLLNDLNNGGSYFNQRTQAVPRFGSSPYISSTDDVGESSGSESVGYPRRTKAESPLQSFATELTTDLRSHSHSHSTSAGGTPPGEQKFVGTPDYLAPETILGLRGDDAAVDWWALGVITYEFLYGIPPFHDETPERVFENILSGHVGWHEEWVDYSAEARDFMERLLVTDPSTRLGAHGAEEVKAHPFFAGIEWDKVTATEAAFIPQINDPESTDYFDSRGAVPMLFKDDEEDADVAVTRQSDLNSPIVDSSMPPPSMPVPIGGNGRETATSTPSDDIDFGSFSYKNVPVLKQINDDVIRKLKTDQMVPLTHAISESTGLHTRRKSVSHRIKKPPSVVTTMDPSNKVLATGPPSPATSTSSIASSPSRTSLPSSTPGSAGGHVRKPSEFGAIERFKQSHLDGVERRNSMPSRLRTASVSSAGDGSGSETWNSSVGHGTVNTPPSSVHSIDLRKGPDPNDRVVTCLLAEDNPITAKIIETLLIRLGCRCVVVADGSEAISVAMGDIKFDCILMDLHMPVLDGEGAARYIKSTNSKNTNVPIIAISAYSAAGEQNEANSLFAASLSKPLQKADLIAVFRQLGFKTTTMQGRNSTKVTASQTITVS
ncbi:hypothetical protein D9757_002657 [Collybiopsis confluens]|uniref:non-specific serine/threonine protein kinase n=1 Tax=Collybiopsis confluens TaxID=2823264 RepID=A0A8H5HWG4_9AGAR|nr:hypothetical protein D9757_002657 [Collybiopsis confluens]